jgi:hypothetical protein
LHRRKPRDQSSVPAGAIRIDDWLDLDTAAPLRFFQDEAEQMNRYDQVTVS